MRLFVFILLTSFSALVCRGQFTDNFSDADYINNPTWTPDNPSNWAFASNQLRSNSTTANTTFYMSTLSTQVLNAQWEFYVNLQFNTSSANFVDVYLISSNASMVSANGYFVRIGGTPDEISLYKSTSGTATILINGTDGVTNTSNNTLKIKVTRDAANLWKLERDVTGTGNSYVTEGTVVDNSFTTGSIFGIRITQSTASFFQKHFFDDFYVGPIIGDIAPPILNSISVVSSTQVDLNFNEGLESISSQLLSNYSVNNGIGNPTSATLQADSKTVRLVFANTFSNGIQNQLTLGGIKDVAGNAIASTSQNFLFFQASPTFNKDILITEIFADPSPQIGLPDAEFIEIFNRSNNPIDLNGWKLSDGSSIATFGPQIILPKEYWIVTSASSASKFMPYGKTIGLGNFPTLNNDNDVLTLKTSITIDSVNYNSSWYQDDDKAAGGWSLELIDPSNLCGEANNWTSSVDQKGGTPGKQNSVFANKPDVEGPKLLAVVAQPNQLTLSFNEKLEKPLGQVSVSILPTLTISNLNLSNAALTEIKISLSQNVAPRQLYTIQVSNLRDCAGNAIQEGFNQLDFALPEAADSLDLVVNEILFNPRPSGVDFVEVYNRSTKYVNLKNYKLANYENGSIRNAKMISTDYILAPASYLIFTSDPFALKTQYTQGIEKKFLKVDMPSLNDDEGSIAISNTQNEILDYFLYSDNFHSSFLKDKEGVSLERISFTQNSNEQSNWKSASSNAGFATPGYLNSSSRPDNFVNENTISIEPEVFSIQLPGQDFSKITYKFDQGGWVANIKIIDQQGRLIKTVANNETLGSEGFFRWDGDQEDGTKARIGYYQVWVEVFDALGNVKTFRKRVVVAAQ
jgi:Lamin Tail Domain/Bacterial Ig-like domain